MPTRKLDVYRCAIQFLALASRVVAEAPRGHSFLTDQLERAALSTPLNIAEGDGRFGAPDAARFYSIARGSAMECTAIVDAGAVLQIADDDVRRRGMELLARIVELLTRMCRGGDARRERDAEATTDYDYDHDS